MSTQQEAVNAKSISQDKFPQQVASDTSFVATVPILTSTIQNVATTDLEQIQQQLPPKNIQLQQTIQQVPVEQNNLNQEQFQSIVQQKEEEKEEQKSDVELDQKKETQQTKPVVQEQEKKVEMQEQQQQQQFSVESIQNQEKQQQKQEEELAADLNQNQQSQTSQPVVSENEEKQENVSQEEFAEENESQNNEVKTSIVVGQVLRVDGFKQQAYLQPQQGNGNVKKAASPWDMNAVTTGIQVPNNNFDAKLTVQQSKVVDLTKYNANNSNGRVELTSPANQQMLPHFHKNGNSNGGVGSVSSTMIQQVQQQVSKQTHQVEHEQEHKKIVQQQRQNNSLQQEAQVVVNGIRDKLFSGEEQKAAAQKQQQQVHTSELSHLKQHTLDAAFTTKRGLDATLEQRAILEEFITCLEAANPNHIPTKAMHALHGHWKLIYTTNSRVLLLLNAFKRLPVVDVGDIWQIIDAKKLTAENKIDIALPVLMQLTASSGFEIRTPRQFKVRFVKAGLDTRIQTPQLLSNIEIPQTISALGVKIDLKPLQDIINPINDGINSAREVAQQVLQPSMQVANRVQPQWLLTTYLDENLRIARDDNQGAFVFVKDVAMAK